MLVGYFQYDVSKNSADNFCKIEQVLQAYKCDVLVLPELCISGYLYEHKNELLSYAESVPDGTSVRKMIHLSKQYQCTIIFGIAEKINNDIYNTAVVVDKGNYIGKYQKIHLTDYEKNFFTRGKNNPVFKIGNLCLGVQICFDLWFPEVSRAQLLQGVNLLCVLGNFGGEDTLKIAPVRALENITPLILCNRVGREKSSGIDAYFIGKSLIINQSGHLKNIPVSDKESCVITELKLNNKHGNIICNDFKTEILLHTAT